MKRRREAERAADHRVAWGLANLFTFFGSRPVETSELLGDNEPDQQLDPATETRRFLVAMNASPTDGR